VTISGQVRGGGRLGALALIDDVRRRSLRHGELEFDQEIHLIRSLLHELLATVDVERGARECGVDNDCDGSNGLH
jgi:hypothetical protein